MHPLASACPSCTLQVYKSHPSAPLVLSSPESSVELLLKKKVKCSGLVTLSVRFV